MDIVLRKLVPNMNYEIKQIVSEHEWLLIKEEWNNLVDSVEDMAVFSRFEWLYAWWHNFGREKNLCILLIFDNNRVLKVIFPFFLRRQSVKGLISFNVISLLGHGYSDYVDIIGHNVDSSILSITREYLSANYPNIIFNFTMVPTESLLIKEFYDGGGKINTKPTKCPYLTLPAEPDIFWQNLGAGTRYNIRRGYRKVAEMGESRFITITEFLDFEKYLPIIFEMQKERFGERLAAKEDIQKYINFILDATRRFCGENIARLIVWFCNDDIVAGQLYFDYKRRRYYLFGGFNEKYYKYDPGKGIIAKAIEDAIDKNMEEYDFLAGDEPYKSFFAEKYHTTVSLTGSLNSFAFHLYQNVEYISGFLRRFK